ncbi:hypothetical protein GCM10020000_07730 [Streptomyces olivoverticillatus]
MARQFVEQPVSDLLDAGPHGLDAMGGELPGDQRPQPGVVRRVGLEHVQPDGVAAVVLPVRRVADVVGQPGIGQGGLGLLMPDDQPGLAVVGGADPVDGPLFAQVGVEGVPVGVEVGAGGVRSSRAGVAMGGPFCIRDMTDKHAGRIPRLQARL